MITAEEKERVAHELGDKISDMANKNVSDVLQLATEAFVKNGKINDMEIPELLARFRMIVGVYIKAVMKTFDAKELGAMHLVANITPEQLLKNSKDADFKTWLADLRKLSPQETKNWDIPIE